MTKLIAQVHTKVMVNGEPQIIQPGAVLPEMAQHDQRALVASGAAKDEAAQAQADKAAEKERAADAAAFVEARRAVRQAEQSTEPPAPAARPAGKK